MSLLKGKRGQVNSFIGGVVFIFAFFLIWIFAYLILSNFVSEFSGAGFNTPVMDDVSAKFLWGFGLFDSVAIIILLAVIGGVAYSSFKVATHPIFFVITFVLAPFLAFMAYMLSYVFSQIVSNPAFNSVVLVFPRSILIGTNLHWVMLACIVVGSVAMFGKKSDRGQFVNE